MNTKLTLKLNKSVIDRAKIYAQKNSLSLSTMVENYFRMVANTGDSEEFEISPNILELSGIIDLQENFSTKDFYQKHLEEKYL